MRITPSSWFYHQKGLIYGVENRFKMQLLLGLKGSPLVGVGITNFVTPENNARRERLLERGSLGYHVHQV